MEKYDDVTWFLGMSQISLGVDILKGILSKEYAGPHQTYASNIDSVTRSVHSHVWGNHESLDRVKKEIIPLFKEAYDSLKDNDEYTEKVKAKHIRENINLRRNNLERYCHGLPSQMINPKRIKELMSAGAD